MVVELSLQGYSQSEALLADVGKAERAGCKILGMHVTGFEVK